jgi:hypothetical protein
MLTLGLCTIATSAASAGGTAKLPGTFSHSMPFSADPTRTPGTVHPRSTDPVPGASADPGRSPYFVIDNTRGELAAFRRKAIADMRTMIGLLVSVEQMKQVDQTLGHATTDGYGFLKEMLVGLIKAKLQA